MQKIILLDWDGPVSNTRTWKMPGCVDPVAIQLLNDLTLSGWRTVLTSTVRKNFRSDDPRAEATDFMRAAGFYVQWYDEWRTDVGYTTYRHLEVARWMMNTELPEDAIFLIIDDEGFPAEFQRGGRMQQIYANSNSGIDYLSISEAYRIMDMNDEQLENHFGQNEEEE